MIDTITQFGMSIWQWFIDNKDAITAFFISGQALSFVAALVMLVKNLKGTNANTASTKKLNKALEDTNEVHDSVVSLDENFKLLKEENDGLREELKETETRVTISNEELKEKLNAIIEVQAIVYSTIRDDSVRQTVNKVLNNARYCEKNFKESLETQIEELKQSYSNELQAIDEKMGKSVDAIKSELSAVKTAEQQMAARNNNIRY